MKKLAVIAAMTLLSLATITACGNKEDNAKENQTNVDNKNENNTDDNSSDNSGTDIDDNTEDPNDDSFGGSDPDSDKDYNNNTDANDNDENNTNDNNLDNTETDADNNTENADNKKDDNTDNTNTDKKDTNKKDNEEKEPVETGVEPDFKLNKKGCFNGSYEGNDGCTYKFTKKGKLIITSDSETLKYEYTLSDDVLSMVAEDGSFGTSRQITLLEDGTYLLDDKMGTQVILTYIES